ncbi:MAG: hypothetical protein C0404_06515 [Verrucomicrobia bacterium]|nr:hypothetical protein [Verrucomicrobiota bacterium]
MKMKTVHTLLVTVLLIAGTAAVCEAGTYYVSTAGSDTNPGTQALPWRTIGKASSVMVAGDTVLVSAGTYNESITTTRNGAPGNRIVFRAAGTVNTGSWAILHNYITVDGFSLSGNSIAISSRDGTNGSYCEVLNNKINAGDISMAYKSNPTGNLIKGNHLYGAVSPAGDWPQIQIWGSNSIAEYNDIGPNSDIDAFRFWGTGHIIRHNYVHDTTYSPDSKAHSDGFQTFGDNGDSANNIVIENNRFINSEGQLFNTSQDGVAGIHDLIFRNNVVVNYSRQNCNVGLPYFYIYNNTFYNVGLIYQVTGGPGLPFNGSYLVVKNNIFVGMNGLANTDFDNVYNNPSGLPFTREYNFYSDGSGNPLNYYTSEAGGINGGNIRFVNAATNNFLLQSNSPAIDHGVTLTGFNYDFAGTTRPKGAAWDIGAYEHVATQTATSLSQWGITWTFDKAYTYGTYANGDYWVLGPVTITAVSPAYAAGRNGWEVNPVTEGDQGFDNRPCVYGGAAFNAALIPNLPYTASGRKSIVKSISRTSSIIYSPLQTVAVLTVVDSIPADNGATVFRPPYVGTAKPDYSVNNLHTNLLPAYARTPGAVSLNWILGKYQHVQMEHKDPGPQLRPTDNYQTAANGDTYGGYVGSDIASATLGLMLNDPPSAKMPALIAYVQSGIDRYHMMLSGQRWGSGEGYNPNMKLPIYFMAALFQDSTITLGVQALPQAWTEAAELYRGRNGTVLFGDTEYWGDPEEKYWGNIIAGGVGNYEYRDPYGIIDGSVPVDRYQFSVLSPTWKGQALAVQLMPALKAIYDYPILLEYADRWVTTGCWTQPDDCAPYDGNPANYGITFGPDGHGGYIKDSNPADGMGRFPGMHGADKDGGYYVSATADEMWAAYRNSVVSNPPAITLQPAHQTVSVGQAATFTVTASGSAPLAYRWQTNTVNISGATNASYTTPATTLAANGIGFRVIVTSASGSVTSSVATLTVLSPDIYAPTVSLAAPANGAMVSNAVTVSATATDNVAVAGVQFKLDGTNLAAEDTTSPFSISWDTWTAGNGSHALTAVARDSAGNAKTSSAVNVTVNNPVGGGLAIASATPAAVKGTNATLTTAAFTPPAGSVLYIAIAINSWTGGGENRITGVTDNLASHLVYEQQAVSGIENTADTVVYLYTASVPTAQAMTVSVTQASGQAAMLKVLVVTGADHSRPVGAKGGGHGVAGVVSDTYISTIDGSLGWLLYADWNVGPVPTAGSNQTVYDSYTVSNFDTYAIIKQNSVTATSGSSVTMSTTAPTSGAQISHLYFEMRPGVSGDMMVSGIPASWLIRHFGGTNAVNGRAQDDWDHDGMNNLAEYIAGTVPTSVSSRLQVSGFVVQAGTNLVINWSSVAGKWYKIQTSTNLLVEFDGAEEVHIPATPAINTSTVIVDQINSRYYRITVEQ